MKLRIHNNSLRLRLSQPDVARLSKTGILEDRVDFPAGQALAFVLASGNSNAAELCAGQIRVTALAADLRQWADSDQEGIEFQSGPLKVAIEKDFQCLHHPGSGESGAFPNPAAKG
jgi:hypothetical protein